MFESGLNIIKEPYPRNLKEQRFGQKTSQVTHLFHGVCDGDELGGEDVAGLDLPAAVDDAEGAGADLLEDVVVVVDGVLRLDVHRLRDVLGVDVEDELVVVLHLALLTPDLLAGLINWKLAKCYKLDNVIHTRRQNEPDSEVR